MWQEFVVAENAGKMSSAQGYWHNALFGAYPMWPQLLAYPINAGLLILPTLVWCLQALMRGVRSGAAASCRCGHPGVVAAGLAGCVYRAQPAPERYHSFQPCPWPS